jgi:hypothetical protein
MTSATILTINILLHVPARLTRLVVRAHALLECIAKNNGNNVTEGKLIYKTITNEKIITSFTYLVLLVKQITSKA